MTVVGAHVLVQFPRLKRKRADAVVPTGELQEGKWLTWNNILHKQNWQPKMALKLRSHRLVLARPSSNTRTELYLSKRGKRQRKSRESHQHLEKLQNRSWDSASVAAICLVKMFAKPVFCWKGSI